MMQNASLASADESMKGGPRFLHYYWRGVWESGSLGVWESGSLGVWESGVRRRHVYGQRPQS